MKKFKHYSSQLATAVTPLPSVMRKPGLVKLWLLTFSAKRVYLLAGVLLFFFAVSPVRQGIVGRWYPQQLRETRYLQLVFYILECWAIYLVDSAITGSASCCEEGRTTGAKAAPTIT